MKKDILELLWDEVKTSSIPKDNNWDTSKQEENEGNQENNKKEQKTNCEKWQKWEEWIKEVKKFIDESSEEFPEESTKTDKLTEYIIQYNFVNPDYNNTKTKGPYERKSNENDYILSEKKWEENNETTDVIYEIAGERKNLSTIYKESFQYYLQLDTLAFLGKGMMNAGSVRAFYDYKGKNIKFQIKNPGKTQTTDTSLSGEELETSDAEEKKKAYITVDNWTSIFEAFKKDINFIYAIIIAEDNLQIIKATSVLGEDGKLKTNSMLGDYTDTKICCFHSFGLMGKDNNALLLQQKNVSGVLDCLWTRAKTYLDEEKLRESLIKIYKMVNNKDCYYELDKLYEALKGSRTFAQYFVIYILRNLLKIDTPFSVNTIICLTKLTWKFTPSKIFSDIDQESQIIYTGAPGTGKTYGIINTVRSLCISNPMKLDVKCKKYKISEDFQQYKFVQFHSSYDYSDFVEGIRPIPDEKGNKFVRLDGVFKEFCRNIAAYNEGDPDNNVRFYFIIDEINRADLGKVFGELMYCFEKNKRENPVQTQYTNLPTWHKSENKYVEYKNDNIFEKGFFIPKNVVIIGSMNDIDRSVETFDFALRRRFIWKELEVKKDLLKSVFAGMGIDTDDALVDRIWNMNQVIAGSEGQKLGLSKAFCIGPAYFKALAEDGDDDNNTKLEIAWNNSIKPILKEYTRGRDPEDVIDLLNKCYEALFGEKINDSSDECFNMDFKNTIEQIVNQKSGNKQVIFTGAPGTGKTFGIEQAVDEILSSDSENKDKRKKFVQFHSSYDYADFVEGLRPIEKDGKTTFVRMDGIFKEFCRKAARETSTKPYFFIIDEINRADLGKVFGELMYCFEYRGENNRVQTQYSNLSTFYKDGNEYKTYGSEDCDDDIFMDGFYIPNNVVVIGSMNDIDRSVETFDFALRRRFKWIDVKANENNLNCVFNGMKNGSVQKPAVKSLINNIKNMNSIILNQGSSFGLNESYWIGPSFFETFVEKEDQTDVLEELKVIWTSRIEPTLREYIRGRNQSSVDNFISMCQKALFKDFK